MRSWIAAAMRGQKGSAAHQPFDRPLGEGEGMAAPCIRPMPASKETLERLHQSIATMPKPSWVWHEIQAAFAEHASLQGIGRIIAQDTALSAVIIRAANSPAYGLLKPIVDVERAVTHLGSNLVRSVATRHCLDVGGFQRPAFFDQQGLWRHAMAVSALAEIIAKDVPRCHVGEAATLGLLHDLGRMLLNHVLNASEPEPSTERLHQHGFLQWESEVAGCSHIEAGMMLAQAWELPEQLMQAIRHHHDPAFDEAENVPEAVRSEVFAVYLADLLAIHLKFPGGNPCKSLPHASWEYLLPKTTLSGLSDNQKVGKALWRVYATDM